MWPGSDRLGRTSAESCLLQTRAQDGAALAEAEGFNSNCGFTPRWRLHCPIGSIHARPRWHRIWCRDTDSTVLPQLRRRTMTDQPGANRLGIEGGFYGSSHAGWSDGRRPAAGRSTCLRPAARHRDHCSEEPGRDFRGCGSDLRRRRAALHHHHHQQLHRAHLPLGKEGEHHPGRIAEQRLAAA